MKFKQFLIEQDDIEQQAQQLKQAAQQIAVDCKPFLQSANPKDERDLKNKMIYRGMQESQIHVTKRPRKKREPKDMPLSAHQYLDKLFYQKFGYYARSSGLFVTNNIGNARPYGIVYGVFPIQQFELIASPHVKDLYGVLTGGKHIISPYENDITKQQKQQIVQYIEQANYQSMSVEQFANLENDIEGTLICDRYHAVNMEQIKPEVVNYFFEQLYKAAWST